MLPIESFGNNPRSLLVIKPSSLGDIIHGLQVLQSVKLRLPECRVTWVVRDRFAGIVESAPFVDEVVVFRRKLGWRGVWEVMKELRKRKFDAVWDMQGLLRSGLMAWAAHAPVKWGRRDCREGAGLFSKKVDLPAGKGPHHAIPVLLEFAKTVGVEDGVKFPLELRRGPVCEWSAFFEGEPTRRFVIFTDSRGPKKEWKGFGRLTQLIFEKIPESRVAWCAGKVEKPEFFVPEGRFLNLTGCPFDEMLELARQPSVFIGNDSGPMHLSAAMGNRVLAIFGPTSPERFGPWPPNSPRTASIVAPGGVLADLSADEVFVELEKLCAR